MPCISVALPGGRFLLQLRGGREFARQLRDFRLLADGAAVKGELQLIRQRCDASRNGVAGRDTGGQKFASRVMAKMVGWFPRRPATDRSGVLFLRTDSECMLLALDDKGNKIRTWHCDHVKRWVAEHRRRIQRLSDDQKAEQRPQASFQSRRESHVVKYRDRIASAIRELAAQVCGVADRMKFASIEYDDKQTGYLERFDWSGLRSRLATKCNEIGIVFRAASSEALPKSQEVLAEENDNENS